MQLHDEHVHDGSNTYSNYIYCHFGSSFTSLTTLEVSNQIHVWRRQVMGRMSEQVKTMQEQTEEAQKEMEIMQKQLDAVHKQKEKLEKGIVALQEKKKSLEKEVVVDAEWEEQCADPLSMAPNTPQPTSPYHTHNMIILA